MKERIQEVIVVEGHHDTEKLRKYFDCDTIETSGTHLGKEVLDRIREAQKTRGVIIFTDPDAPGNQIRQRINEAVPDCKNAFIEKRLAHTTKKVGVEHADEEALRDCLANLTAFTVKTDTLTMQDMLELGLSGDRSSAEKREKLGRIFHLGCGNAKTMLKRLNYAGITKERIQEALQDE